MAVKFGGNGQISFSWGIVTIGWAVSSFSEDLAHLDDCMNQALKRVLYQS